MKKTNATVQISSQNKGQRLDKFLAEFDASRSRAGWQKMIKSGNVLVSGIKAEADYILKENDRIEILPEEEKPADKKTAQIPDINIIYEDDDVIVIDKPIGIVAQKAKSTESPAVTDFLEKYFPPIKKVGENEQRSGIVHRLDKDTSGIMIAAKNQKTFEFLKAKFKNREVNKIYTALVYGRIKPETGEVNLAIGRSPKMPCRQTTVKNPEQSSIKCRPARTLYETIQNFPDFSLLRVELKTGRMHQIRVHMKAIGHPVAGDRKYAGKKLLARTPELGRQFLHATELEIALPKGKEMVFRSELPADLDNFLKSLPDLD